MGLCQIKSFSLVKETINEMVAYWMGEDIHKSYIQ